MKRALAVTGFTMLGILTVFCNIKNDTAMSVAIIVSLIALLLSLIIKPVRKNGTLPTAFLSVLIALCVLFLNNSAYFKNAVIYSEKELTVSGKLIELPYKSNGNSYYVIETDTINGGSESVKVRLVSSSPLDLRPTDRVTVNIKSFLLGTNDDYLNYYKSKGLMLGGLVNGDAKIEKGVCTEVYDEILNIRYKMINAVMYYLPNDYGAVVSGLTLGDKTNLSPRAENAFAACGVSHLFAVSGLHMSVWSMLFYRFAKGLRLSRKSSSAISILFCIFFMLLTGCNPPVIRSGVMMILFFASNLFSREAEAFNSIGFALSIMLILNPYSAQSISLWLSLLATMGILILSGRINGFISKPLKNAESRILKRVFNPILSVISVSIAVTAFTLPVYVLRLNTVSVLLLISNLVMLSFGTLCMEAGGIAAVFLVLGVKFIGAPLLLFSGFISKLLLKTALFLSRFRYALIPVDSNYSKIILAVFVTVLAVFLILNIKNKSVIRSFSVVTAIVFLIANTAVYFLNFNSLKICAANVGNGMSVVVMYKGETAILGCGGDYYAESAICDIIKTNGVNIIDALVVPDGSKALSSAANGIMDGYDVKKLYIGSESEKNRYSYNGEVSIIDRSVISLSDGEVLIAVQNDSVCTSAQIIYGSFRAVISFSADDTLHGANGNLLICRNTIPNGADVGRFHTITVSADSTEEIIQAEFANNICSTADNGSISFLVKPNGEFSYRRMQ